MSKKSENTKTQQKAQSQTKHDFWIWILIVALLVIAIGANFYFREIVWSLRLVGWIIVAAIEIALFALTTSGKKFWKFAKESRLELRKVVWPNRQQTIRTTAIIAGLVLVAALLMWGVDSILLWLIGLLTGQRG